jgi:hypothetical protein
MSAAVTTFVAATDEPTGKRAACVAGMIKMLCEADGEPIPWTEMCDEVGMEHHGQLMPAMHALELVGAVERYTFAEDTGTRAKVAYALADGVVVEQED